MVGPAKEITPQEMSIQELLGEIGRHERAIGKLNKTYDMPPSQCLELCEKHRMSINKLIQEILRRFTVLEKQVKDQSAQAQAIHDASPATMDEMDSRR